MATNEQVDYLRKIALIGGTGTLGSNFLNHLLAGGKHQITVLSRADSKATFPSDANLKVAKVDYASEDSMVEALRGQDFLIITLPGMVAPKLHPVIVQAAAKAGVKWILPNYFGAGLGERSKDLHTDPVVGRFQNYLNDVKQYEGEGVSYIALCCGFWYEWSLSRGEPWLGFDIQKRTVTFYDDGKTKLNTTTFEQCGRAVSSLLSLPFKDRHPAVQDWKNQGLYVSSFLISQRDILDSLNRVLGTTDADWTITYEPVKERYARGVKDLQGGNFLGFATLLYARLLFPDHPGDYETGYELDNGKLGLPKEDFDEATKKAIEMSKTVPSDYSNPNTSNHS